jgi:tetratricopeptide (TPR) repeat protein
MSGLVARDGAHRLQLDVLSPSESVHLLATLTGERAYAEADVVAELARRCAHLPLGLRLVAEFLASRPNVGLAEHLADFDAAGPLDQLDAGGDEHTSLRAVFSWSYRRLPPEAARAFRLLGAHPGRDYDDYAVAALVDSSLSEARRLLRILFRAHLLDDMSADRYAMHDLLHAYAVDFASHDPEVPRALDRLCTYYVWCATNAHRVLYQYDNRWVPDIAAQPPVPAPSLDTDDAALAWFEGDRNNLVAVIRSAPARAAIDLAASIDRYLNTWGAHYAENLAVHQAALVAARSIGDQPAEVRTIGDLGRLLGQTTRFDEAIDYLTRASTAAVGNDHVTASRSLNGLGLVQRRLGLAGAALDSFRTAATVAQQAGDLFSEANALGNLGLWYADAHQFARALSLYSAALTRHSEVGCRRGEGQVQDSIANVYLDSGEIDQAIDHFQQALTIAQETRSPDNEAPARNGLGRALRIAGRLSESRTQHELALRLGRQIGDAFEVARALTGLGELAYGTANTSEAHRRWSEAVRIYKNLGVPVSANLAQNLHDVERSADIVEA